MNARLVFASKRCFKERSVHDAVACQLPIQQQFANEGEIGA
jgi:hypothetical protein